MSAHKSIMRQADKHHVHTSYIYTLQTRSPIRYAAKDNKHAAIWQLLWEHLLDFALSQKEKSCESWQSTLKAATAIYGLQAKGDYDRGVRCGVKL